MPLTLREVERAVVVLAPRVVPREPLPRAERARAAYLLLRERVFSSPALSTA